VLGEKALRRAALLGLATGLGTLIWLASLGVVLWQLPLGAAGDYVVLLIVFCAVPFSLLVGASVFSHTDPRGRGPTDDMPVRRRPQMMRRPPHDMF
jgi:hypothetical protein